MLKLEEGHCSTRPDYNEPFYDIISDDDDLPDLEEESWKTGKVTAEDGVKKTHVLESPESPTPESQMCSTSLRFNLQPIRVPLYEDISSSESDGPIYEDISDDDDENCKAEVDLRNDSSVIVQSDKDDNSVIVIDSQDESVNKTPQKLVHQQESPFKTTEKQDSPSTPQKLVHHPESPLRTTEKQESPSTSPSAQSSPGVENLFNQKIRQKLAGILKQIKPSKSIVNDGCSSPLQRTNSESSLSSMVSQNERHFLDVLGNGTVGAEEANAGNVDGGSRNLSITDNKDKAIIKKPQYRRKVHLRCRTQTSSEESEEDKKKFKGPCVLELLKPLRINFLTDDVDVALSQVMSDLHINTVNSCFEEGMDFLEQGLQFIHDFLDSYQIPQSMFKDIVMIGLIKRDTRIMLKSYKLLLIIHEKNPALFSKLEWDTVKTLIEELSIGRGLWNQEPVILHMVGLYLKVLIMAFEEELHNSNLKDPRTVRQTNVYKILSYDSGYINLKEVVNWIRCSITSGEYPEVRDTVYLRHLAPEQDLKDLDLRRQETPKMLPLLQKLVSLGISVSSSPLECAKIMGSELLKTYIYLTSIKHKRLLIETISSNILRFRLISLVILNHCEESLELGYDFPQDLKSIYECYYCALPPRCSPLTPPTTPQSDEENEQSGPRVEHYSSVQVEELAMILYYVTQSYLQCKKRKGHNVLRRKAHMSLHELNSLSAEDERDLRQLPAQVEELRGYLLTLTSELTDNTHLYLNLMMCLS
ncbi:uncharacterized protein LOC125658326 isoform X5 [Ostrea edulis]|nr:uncharacterized protein LOC125658326 isoform X5 [Ostrea edulis]